jgi:hypothetical protein
MYSFMEFTESVILGFMVRKSVPTVGVVMYAGRLTPTYARFESLPLHRNPNHEGHVTNPLTLQARR